MENTISDKSRLWTLFKTCFIISACTFGGGIVIISMLQKKFVEELHWISQDEVMDLVAIAQSCPGVMAVNTSIIIGYHIAGVAGALLTVTGTILPPMIILTIVSMFYVQFHSNPVIALLLKGMQAGVAAVMINMTITMAGNVLKDREITIIQNLFPYRSLQLWRRPCFHGTDPQPCGHTAALAYQHRIYRHHLHFRDDSWPPGD